MTLVEFAVTCYNWLFLVERKKMPEQPDVAEEFTNAIMGIFAAYVDSHHLAEAGLKPNIVRMEDNRILWQFGQKSMSITINDVSAEYS